MAAASTYPTSDQQIQLYPQKYTSLMHDPQGPNINQKRPRHIQENDSTPNLSSSSSLESDTHGHSHYTYQPNPPPLKARPTISLQKNPQLDPAANINKSLPPPPSAIHTAEGAVGGKLPSSKEEQDDALPSASHAMATISAMNQEADSMPLGAAQMADHCSAGGHNTMNSIGVGAGLGRIYPEARVEEGEKGEETGQVEDGPNDTTDLGWHDPPELVPEPLVGGISNDDLWTLIRRFNKQIQHVRALPHTQKLPADLDLLVSPSEQFSPDRLRGNIERLYMTVFVGLAAAVKHVARLRSWVDFKRTGVFCLVYFTAWWFDLLGVTLSMTLTILILSPRARDTLFPPLPALVEVDAKTGKVKGVESPVPAGSESSVAFSRDSLTGAKEAQKGEAVEQEAHNFVSAFGEIAISSAAGKQHGGSSAPDSSSESEFRQGKSAPDPTTAAIRAVDAKDSAEGTSTGTKASTKQPVEAKIWEKARPAMQTIGTVTDVWEQFGNMLSPTPPFPVSLRYRLASTVGIPLIFASCIITPYILVKFVSLLVGLAFFSKPGIDRLLSWLGRKYPQWTELLDIRSTLLKKVPTNAQLTITLLRIGEAHHAPLPPPPTRATTAIPPATPPTEDTPDTFSQNKKVAKEHENEDGSKEKPKLPSKAISAVKSTTKTAVNTALHTDHLKAKLTHSEAARKRLGAVPEQQPPPVHEQGPKQFAARYQGVKGTAVILEPRTMVGRAETKIETKVVDTIGPVLKWTRDKPVKKSKLFRLLPGNDKDEDESEEEEGFIIPISSIIEIEKLGGLGWKEKVVVGWSLEKEVVDAIRIVYARNVPGKGMLKEEKILTAVLGREEIVNRLLAMGEQRWECV